MNAAQGGAHEPVIVGFLCTWCAYLAADAAGMARTDYAPNMRPIRVLCSSRVEPEFVLRALRDGADGVLIAGCHPGACHYGDGSLKALRRFALLQRLLDQFGLERERVQLVWVAASEGAALAAAVDRMTRQLRALEPLAWTETVLRGEAPGW
ncbi:MAG TPA: hydrogenase iron-sulfur subunit [Candidatus Methanoperedens sp.]|nr:hydrogenase iron-sulfur subunit [Candidatus Methanoperedens sp.]